MFKVQDIEIKMHHNKILLYLRPIWLSAFYIMFCCLSLIVLPVKLATYLCILFPLTIVSFYYFVHNKRWLIYLYLFSIPFVQHYNIYPIPIGDFLITPHMLIQFVLSLIIFIDFLSRYNSEEQYILSTFDKTILLIGLFSLSSLIFPYYLDVNHTKRWLYFYTGLVEPITFYFVILYSLRRKIISVNEIFSAIALSILPSFLIAIYEYNAFGFSLVKIFFNRDVIGYGFHNANIFGIFSSLVLPIVFFKVADSKNKTIYYVCLFVIVTLSGLTLNRGTIIVVLFQIGLLFIIKENRKRIYFLFMLLLIFLIINNELFVVYGKRFFGGTESQGINSMLDKSALYRLGAWLVGLESLIYYPLGAGAGSFQYLWEKYGYDPTFFLGSSHSIFISIGNDYGVFTMLLFIAIIIYTLKYLYKNKSNNNMYKYLFISILGYVIYSSITFGELSHLTGKTWPNNGYTLVLMTIISSVSFQSSKENIIKEKQLFANKLL